jgi:hypothetical protein
VSQSDLLSELDRRRTQAVNERLEKLTEEVRDMTAHIRNLTWAVLIIAVAAAGAALLTMWVTLSSTG